MASTALTRPLYRALLRGAAKAEAAGASAADLAALLPPGSAAPCGDARATVRAAFRTPGGSVDAALAALPKVSRWGWGGGMWVHRGGEVCGCGARPRRARARDVAFGAAFRRLRANNAF